MEISVLKAETTHAGSPVADDSSLHSSKNCLCENLNPH